jgi:LmbE family N-acetylglucosaminyl deacetylase
VVEKKRIVCIHAHPDDAEILAGGTLALLAQRGHAVTIVTMTPGDCGTTEYGPEEISAIRREEAREAAALIGADYVCAEFRDLAVFSDDPSRRRVTALIRRLRPDLVLTASPVDYMCDHEATSMLVRDACFGAGAPNYDCTAYDSAPAIDHIPHLYYIDPIGGMDRDAKLVAPDFVVDVGSTFETKRAMLAKHDSQRQWLFRHHGMDNYLETMEQWTRNRGRLAGREFGEGFRLYKGHPYPQTPLLEELLGSDLVVRT